MAMNREQKRMLQRQGAVDAEGAPTTRRQAPQQPRPKPNEERLPFFQRIRQYFREVVSEMRKVSFPTKPETITYSIVVFVMLVLLTSGIGLLDFGISHLVLKVFS